MEEPTAGLVRSRPQVEVVRANDAHDSALAEFYRAVWDRDATEESVRSGRKQAAAANPVERGAESPRFVFLRDGQVLGHIGTIPARFWNGAEECAGAWFKGFMVLPEHRNGPVGFTVLKEAIRQSGISAVLTVALPSRRLFAALGFVDHGPVPNHLLVLRPGKVLGALDVAALGMGDSASGVGRLVRLAQRLRLAHATGVVAGVGFALWKGLRGFGARRATIHTGASVATPDEITALWLRARESLAAAQVRDADYLIWRFAAPPADTYEFAAVRERGALAGIAVVRRPREDGDPRLRGIKVATLSDILFDPTRPDIGMATLRAAEHIARRMGADAMLCTASHAVLAAALRRRAFVRLSGNVHFMLRDPGNEKKWPVELERWWITRGDAESDGVF
jgi:predicted N-acetyltransferase YhbS